MSAIQLSIYSQLLTDKVAYGDLVKTSSGIVGRVIRGVTNAPGGGLMLYCPEGACFIRYRFQKGWMREVQVPLKSIVVIRPRQFRVGDKVYCPNGEGKIYHISGRCHWVEINNTARAYPKSELYLVN